MSSSNAEVSSRALGGLQDNLKKLSGQLQDVCNTLNSDRERMGQAWTDAKFQEFREAFQSQIDKCSYISERYDQWCVKILQPAIDKVVRVENVDVTLNGSGAGATSTGAGTGVSGVQSGIGSGLDQMQNGAPQRRIQPVPNGIGSNNKPSVSDALSNGVTQSRTHDTKTANLKEEYTYSNKQKHVNSHWSSGIGAGINANAGVHTNKNSNLEEGKTVNTNAGIKGGIKGELTYHSPQNISEVSDTHKQSITQGKKFKSFLGGDVYGKETSSVETGNTTIVEDPKYSASLKGAAEGGINAGKNGVEKNVSGGLNIDVNRVGEKTTNINSVTKAINRESEITMNSETETEINAWKRKHGLNDLANELDKYSSMQDFLNE